MMCTETTSVTQKVVLTSAEAVIVATLAVQTHTAPGAEVSSLTLGDRVLFLPVEEAARLFDKMPGARVRVKYEQSDCDDAEHDDSDMEAG